MRIPIMSMACKQVQPLVSFQGGGGGIQVDLNMDAFFRRKDKVVFVIGATGTGKSRLAIDLATRFPAEVINSDKMQLYKGLDITTNKVTDAECRGVPHHLLGVVPDPDSSFSAADFCRHATVSVESILARGRLPIVAGGSNSYIEALVDGAGAGADHHPQFRLRYECCFLWVDVSPPVLRAFVSDRVDRMVAAGLVDEVRRLFDPAADYSRGIRRAIGVPELDEFLRTESRGADERTKSRLLRAAVDRIKDNTCKLAARQLQKIHRLQSKWGWSDNFRRLDATDAFLKRSRSEEAAEEAWESLVAGPGITIVDEFLYGEGLARPSSVVLSQAASSQVPIAAVAGARR